MKTKICIIILLISAVQIFPQWNVQYFSNPSMLNSLDFSDTLHGVAGGWSFGGPAVLYTINGGINWILSVIPGGTSSIVSLVHVSTNVFFGASTTITLPLGQEYIKNKFDEKGLLIVDSPIWSTSLYYYGTGSQGIVIKSTDSGINWFIFGSIPDSCSYVRSLYFIDEITGYAASEDSTQIERKCSILKTTDGGNKWVRKYLPERRGGMRSVYFINVNTGYCAGTFHAAFGVWQGSIFKTTDGGSTWNFTRIEEVNNFKDICFANAQIGFAVGIRQDNSGAIYTTTDGGANWRSLTNTLYNMFIEGVSFIEGTGIFLGEDFPLTNKAYIFRTTNYGNTLSNDSTTIIIIQQPEVMLSSSTMVNLQTWFAAGGDPFFNGVILKTTNGGNPIGINALNNEIPELFSLDQNYPNPFNPNTIIGYHVPEASFVRLIVYNAIGKEIAVLVNEKNKPGSYQAEWDASNYASGVYFYKLITESFTDTKKMILIK